MVSCRLCVERIGYCVLNRRHLYWSTDKEDVEDDVQNVEKHLILWALPSRPVPKRLNPATDLHCALLITPPKVFSATKYLHVHTLCQLHRRSGHLLRVYVNPGRAPPARDRFPGYRAPAVLHSYLEDA